MSGAAATCHIHRGERAGFPLTEGARRRISRDRIVILIVETVFVVDLSSQTKAAA